jgi:hypothetical protein
VHDRMNIQGRYRGVDREHLREYHRNYQAEHRQPVSAWRIDEREFRHLEGAAVATPCAGGCGRNSWSDFCPECYRKAMEMCR